MARRPALALNLSIGRRFIAVVGDEGATVLLVSGRELRRALFLARPDDPRAGEVRSLLAANPNTVVSILIDTLEQSYREVELPNVGPLDRGRMVKRKLALTYGTDQLSAALPLAGLAAGGDRRYLFASLPRDRGLRGWLSLFTDQGNPVAPLALLPVESVALPALLRGPDPPVAANEPTATRIVKGGTAPAREGRVWRLLLSRQRASGFRQTVIQGDQMVVTRLTPGIDEGASAAEIVENIEREFASTVTYLRRLSFTDADRLELTVIAEPEVIGRLDARRLRIRQMIGLSPREAAQRLGLATGTLSDERFADAVLGTWYAQRASPVLSIDTPDLAMSRLLNRVPRAVMAGAAVVGVAGFVYGASAWVEMDSVGADVVAQRQEIERLEAELAAEKAQAERLPLDPDEVRTVIDTAEMLAPHTPRVARIVAGVRAALEPGERLTSLEIRLTNPARSPADRAFGPPEEATTATEPDIGAFNEAGDLTAGTPAEGAEPAIGPRGAVLVSVRADDATFSSLQQINDRFAALEGRLRSALPGLTLTVERPAVDLSGAVGGTGAVPTSVTAVYRLAGVIR